MRRQLRSRNTLSTPQASRAALVAASARIIATMLSALAIGGCSAAAPRPVPGVAPCIAVVAPASECDPVSILVDGVVQRGQWYCSHAPAPQVYELMFADTTPRPVHAVGFVAGNLGPDGVGPVLIRVQTGHGVMAEGETFRAVPRGRGDQMQVITLPRTVTGDHVVLTFERRSRYSTALCLGEIAAWGDDYPQDPSVAMFRARAYVPPASSSPPPALAASESPAPASSEPPSSAPPENPANPLRHAGSAE